jgi:hypothetical protein
MMGEKSKWPSLGLAVGEVREPNRLSEGIPNRVLSAAASACSSLSGNLCEPVSMNCTPGIADDRRSFVCSHDAAMIFGGP